MPEKDAKFYNERNERAFVELELSSWLPMYKTALRFLPDKNTNPKVIDLGCGAGRFAKLMHINGYKDYWGIDFSDVLIEECQRYVPDYPFDVLDVFSQEALSKFKDFNTFVVLEILEHLEDDLKLLESIPSGSNVIFSVPNHLSKAHVRAFNNKAEAIERYKHLVDIQDFGKMVGKKPWDHIAPDGTSKFFRIEIFVFKGVKK